ncbi:sensor histidine kinase [Arcanobacterium phocae]|uniref:sensor histidine kinase n=1 Tax=Arcanobacterium phocae TaxID=131112 RepID=UPI001C0F357F|nr:histidine kinase [Arcanobacterium phocae]
MQTRKSFYSIGQITENSTSVSTPLRAIHTPIYLLLATLSVLAEIGLNPAVLRLDQPQLWIVVVFGITLAVSAWKHSAQILYILIFLASSFWPATSNLALPALGVYLICITWMIRKRLIPALITLALTGCMFLDFSEPLRPQLFREIVMFVSITSIGTALCFLVNRVKLSAQNLEEARQASATIRANLAAELHDTIAKDLAQIAITAQNISLNHPHLAHELDPLSHMAQNAAHRIRPIILNLDSHAQQQSLDEAITMSATMLTTRSITLNIDSESHLDAKLDHQTINLTSLFVREAATNALKYAPPNTIVDLIIELSSNTISLTMRNDIAEQNIPTHLTGGYGLANLQQHIHTSGGNLSFFRHDNEWVIIATLPLTQGNHYE